MSFLLNSFSTFGGTALGSTWDPANSGTNLSYSGGNLIASKTTANGYSTARSNTSKATGKWYAEVKDLTNATPGDGGIGVCRSTFTQTGNYPGQASPSVGIRGNGFGNNDGTSWASGAADLTWNDGTWVFIAVDATNSLVWFKKNGGTNWNNSGTADPASGVGGLTLSGSGGIFIAAAVYGFSPSDTLTANFGASGFAGTVPTGFSAWG